MTDDRPALCVHIGHDTCWWDGDMWRCCCGWPERASQTPEPESAQADPGSQGLTLADQPTSRRQNDTAG